MCVIRRARLGRDVVDVLGHGATVAGGAAQTALGLDRVRGERAFRRLQEVNVARPVLLGVRLELAEVRSEEHTSELQSH